MQYLGAISKMKEWSQLISKANHWALESMVWNQTVIQVCAPITNAKEVEVEQFYEDLLDFLVWVLVTQSCQLFETP